jgi:hypothetical protein
MTYLSILHGIDDAKTDTYIYSYKSSLVPIGFEQTPIRLDLIISPFTSLEQVMLETRFS